MDAETGAILALQILALCSIVAALLAYLMRQSRNANDEYETRTKRHVLVTSCDTSLGLQIALALYEAGYKVLLLLLLLNPFYFHNLMSLRYSHVLPFYIIQSNKPKALLLCFFFFSQQ